MKNSIGIMQGRLTPSPDGKLQFFPAENWENEFHFARQIGFENIEWIVEAENYGENPLFEKEKIEIINDLQKTSRVKINSICADIFCEYEFFGKGSQLSRAILIILISQAVKINARQIIIPFLGKTAITPENRAEISKQISFALITAKDFGIKLALETSLPAKELTDFILGLKSDYASVCYDTGNRATVIPKHEIPEEIRQLGGLISEIHIKDRKFGSETSCPLGTGNVPFKEVFKTLKDINFQGPIIIQAARDPKTDDVDLCKKYLDFVKKHIKEADHE